jgi:hypothetical protein
MGVEIDLRACAQVIHQFGYASFSSPRFINCYQITTSHFIRGGAASLGGVPTSWRVLFLPRRQARSKAGSPAGLPAPHLSK